MARAGYQIGFLAVVLLVLLRIAIGWHFLYEGMWKYKTPSFSAESFFKQARGPWAEKFHELVPDYDGRERLSAPTMLQRWDDHRQLLAGHYNFSEEQTAEAGRIYDRYAKQLRTFLDEIDTEQEVVDGKPVVVDGKPVYIDAEQVYLNKLDALAASRMVDPTADAVPFQQKRYHDEETKLRKQAAGWLAEVDRLDREYKQTLASLLEKDQIARGAAPTPKSKLEQIDLVTTYGLIAIGGGLILGLFTRLSCFAGAVFLASIVLAQPAWPSIYPPLPPSAGHSLIVNKELIEMLALLALGATPVGRWAGLDFFVHSLIIRPCCGGKGARHASHARTKSDR